MVREGLQSHCSLRSVPVFLKERQGASAANRTRHLGRFKRFPVQSDDQLLGLSRYAELNPSSAALVGRAQQRRWGSLWSRTRGKEAVKAFLSPAAGGMAGELDGSRQRSFDHEGIRPSAGEHRERTTIRRREVGAGNGKRSRPGADRSSGRPPMESDPIDQRGDKHIKL